MRLKIVPLFTLVGLATMGLASLSYAEPITVPTGLSDSFTGPTGQLYLTDYATSTVYVVQGSSVVSSFAMAYGGSNSGDGEVAIAVTNTVNTRGDYPPAGTVGGQYTLSGTPTGTTYAYPFPSGIYYEQSYDGTSDGTSNYYVQYFGQGYNLTENVYQTGLDWSNPVERFSVQTAPGDWGEYLGISYDAFNNSLWISGWGDQIISDYSLSGQLLSSFVPATNYAGALAFDPSDGTLWYSFAQSNTLYQYDTNGTLLQVGTPSGLPGGSFEGGEFAEARTNSTPEPGSLMLLGTGLLGLGRLVRRKVA